MPSGLSIRYYVALHCGTVDTSRSKMVTFRAPKRGIANYRNDTDTNVLFLLLSLSSHQNLQSYCALQAQLFSASPLSSAKPHGNLGIYGHHIDEAVNHVIRLCQGNLFDPPAVPCSELRVPDSSRASKEFLSFKVALLPAPQLHQAICPALSPEAALYCSLAWVR